MKAILIALFSFLALLGLSGCTTEQVNAFSTGVTAAAGAAKSVSETYDRFEHPEAYRPRYNAAGQPTYP